MAFVVAALYVVLWAAFAWMDSRAIDKPTGPPDPAHAALWRLARDPHRLAGERRGAATRNARVADAAAEPGVAAMGGEGRRHVRARAAARRRTARPAAQSRRRQGLSWTADVASSVVPIFVLLTAISLYLSTLCRSAVGAMVVSFPTIAAVFALAPLVQRRSCTSSCAGPTDDSTSVCTTRCSRRWRWVWGSSRSCSGWRF